MKYNLPFMPLGDLLRSCKACGADFYQPYALGFNIALLNLCPNCMGKHICEEKNCLCTEGGDK